MLLNLIKTIMRNPNSVTPEIKVLTKKQLIKLKTPLFQRWIVEQNIIELQQSIEESGFLRLPIICHVKNDGETILIDGNHLVRVIERDERYSMDDKFSCIYTEAENLSEAGEMFKNLNTKGRRLDWIDITNLYMHLNNERNNIYEVIWHSFLNNPQQLKDCQFKSGFKIATIIEFLCKDKVKFRSGDATRGTDFIGRKNLLHYLISATPLIWQEKFTDKGLIAPNGGAIIGAANWWFSNKLHMKYEESFFLEAINSIFLDNNDLLKSRKLTINRDNGAALLKDYFDTRKFAY